MRRYVGLDVKNLPDRVFSMVGGDHFDVFEGTDEVDTALEGLVPS